MTADTVDKVRVAVRVRPLNKRERELGTTVVVEMQGNQTILYSPLGSNRRDSSAVEDSNHNPRLPSKDHRDFEDKVFNKRRRSFAFDHCFMSMSPSDRNFASQEDVFNCLGRDLLDSAFSGYNGCIFAYGQTGSGKSYTMMGTRTDEGIIPRLCGALFSTIAQITAERMDVSCKVEVSYMEIYNEKVHDLLDVKGGGGGKKNLRVREHKLLGPYVDGLSQLVVTSFEDIDNLMSEGNKSRTVAATNMNSESSRSHAVFNIVLTQTLTDLQTEVSGEKVSKISLVDLAGSERAQKTGAVGERLREGSNINRSLTTLGLVISALADQASGSGKFVPYRDSVLTWLLKDNLGGNSKTVMVATLSPAGDNYEETLSTLRYADRAKRIVNHAVINEDPNAKIIRELREEVDRLRKELDSAKHQKAPELADKLEESEKLMKELTKTWEEKLEETERIHKERHETLEKMGISVEGAGIKVENTKFFLVNLNADPSLNELLVYYLKHDKTQVGASESCDIRLNGLGIKSQHCLLEIVPPDDNPEFTVKQAVYLTPRDGARTTINGKPAVTKTRLKHGDRILWGMHSFYRLSCPRDKKKKKKEVLEEAAVEEGKKETGEAWTEQQVQQQQQPEDAMMSSMLVTSTSSSGFEHMMGFADAQAEVMQAELSWPCDPSGGGEDELNESKQQLQSALARQKAMYEEQLELLKSQLMLSPMQGNQTTPMTPFSPWNSSVSSGLNAGLSAQNLHIQSKYREWAQEREQLLMQSLARLREQVARANTLVREANFMSQDLGKQVDYSVTLQVPAENLTPNKKRAGLVSEPAVQVNRHGKTPQIWSMTKFENKIIDMREVYEEYKERMMSSSMYSPDTSHLTPLNSETEETTSGDGTVPDVMYFMPGGQLLVLNDTVDDEAFFDSQENHSLIGVANLFLASLFHNVEISYFVPIINQQGEISGKLQMKLARLEGHMPTPGVDRDSEALPGFPQGSNASPDGGGFRVGSLIRLRVTIIQAVGLPAGLSHFAFCQYQLWGQSQPTMVGPAFQPDFKKKTSANKVTVQYDHSMEFNVPLTDEFVEHCAESALSVEVWGNPASGFHGDRRGKAVNGHGEVPGQELTRFSDRWQELCRRLELWVCVEELNDNGVYEKVEVVPAVANSSSSSAQSSPASCPDSPTTGSDEAGTGGIYQLKHGQSRRVTVAVRPKRGGGDLPLICESIQSVCMGCVTHRVRGMQRGLDSYQEVDLNLMRDCWSEAVRRRQDYLHERLQLLVDRAKKTTAEEERERSLMSQWMQLTAERDAVLVPEPGSGIPGAPASWKPVDGMERHCPVVFLNLKPEDMTSLSDKLLISGHNCLLPKEHSVQTSYIQLPLVKYYRSSVIGAVGQWDASMHDSIYLNRVTPVNERVYMIIKVVVRLSHPATMDLVLRKRVCVNIYRKQSLRGYLARQWNKYITADDSITDYHHSPLNMILWPFRTDFLRQVIVNKAMDFLRDFIDGLFVVPQDWDFIFESDAVNRSRSQLRWTGVTYQIVSSIPQASQEMEDRESLARLAASEDTEGSGAGGSSSDGQSYIEKYIRSVSAVEGILQLDRLRQEVAVKDALAAMARKKRRTAIQWELQQRMEDYNNSGLRKYISVPNLQAMNRSSSMTSLTLMQTSAITPSAGRTESVFNLSDQGGMTNSSILLDTSKTSNTSGVRKRPEPPKGLLVAAKNPLISPLSTGPKYGTLVGGLSSASRPSMGTLEEEERLRKPHCHLKSDENESKTSKENDDQRAPSAMSSNFENCAVSEVKNEESTDVKLSDASNLNHSEFENGNDEAMPDHGKGGDTITDCLSISKSHGNEEITDDSVAVDPLISSSFTQESLSETTGPSSGYDSQAISTTTLESEDNLASQATETIAEADTPRGEPSSDETTTKDPNQDSVYCEETSLRKGGSLNEEEWNSMMDDHGETGKASESIAGWIRVGEPVKVDSSKGRQPGMIRFVGTTQFAPGTWIGVELEQAEGKNDGSVQSVRYFKCRKRHGVFVRQDKLTPHKKRIAKSGTVPRSGQGSGTKARK